MPNFQTHTVTSISDIPSLVGDFADSIGWTVNDTDPTQPILTHPSLVGAIPMRCRASFSGTNNQDQIVRWEAVSTPAVTSDARISAPKLNGSSSNLPDVPAPTNVYLFGDITPEPYLALVVRFSGGFYRHLYFGYLEKEGNFTGGECISGSSPAYSTTTLHAYTSTSHGYLFSGRQEKFADSECGGVNVVHADNPTPWRRFKSAVLYTSLATTQQDVLGGFLDSINTGYLQVGRSSYANAAVLVPINLWATRASGRISLIGAPPGVRMVRMDDILENQVVSVADETWRVFPQFYRSTATSPVDGTFWMATETSYLIGLAYRET